jgi:hypothetical protein
MAQPVVHVAVHTPTEAVQGTPSPIHNRSDETSGEVPPLIKELESSSPSALEPLAFFVSWQVRLAAC